MIFGGFFSAIAFLTIIPVPDALKSRRENGMFAGYPAAGLAIGALLSAAAAGSAWLFPPVVAAVVLTGISVLLTGAIHLDGLADCADAFYGRRDRETVLRILKDPRVGTMGGAAIGLSLLFRTAAFLSLPRDLLLVALPVAGVFSRSSVLGALRVLPYVRSSSGIISGRPAVGRRHVVLALAAFVVCAIFLPVPAITALGACLIAWRVSWTKIGGCTGDVLGATIETGEVVFLLVLAAQLKAGLAWGAAFSLLGPVV